jgi:hypothetical protein
MADYKEGPGSGYITNLIDDVIIPKDEENKHYKEYLIYVAEGGETILEFTDSEELENERDFRFSETMPEYKRRFELYVGKHRGIDWEHAVYYRVLNAKVDGTATQTQLDKFAIVNHLRDCVEALQDYIEDEARTLTELQNLDVTDNTHWPAPS